MAGRTMNNTSVSKSEHHYIMHLINPIMAIYNIFRELLMPVLGGWFQKYALAMYDFIPSFNIYWTRERLVSIPLCNES